jgi:hypothetical protein
VSTRCEIVRVRDLRLVGTHMLDLSSRGMLLETDMPILTGETVAVAFEWPGGGDYDCLGTVARVIHGRRRADRHRAVGIEFDRLDPCSELWLCEHLGRTPLARSGPGDARAPARS